jgi:hypothetical protein
MTRISSRQVGFLKYGLPVFFLGLTVAVVAAMLVAGRETPVPWVVIVSLPVFMLALGAMLMKTLILDLADEVHDAGDHLVVRKGDITERVPLREIANIGWTVMINPPRVTLTLRKSGRLGREIVFSPRQPLIQLGRNPLVTQLIERVDAARRA